MVGWLCDQVCCSIISLLTGFAVLLLVLVKICGIKVHMIHTSRSDGASFRFVVKGGKKHLKFVIMSVVFRIEYRIVLYDGTARTFVYT